jgi:alanyl-tRNA synthetase
VRERRRRLAKGVASSGPSADDLLAGAAEVDGVAVVTHDVGQMPVEQIRRTIDQLKRKGRPVAVMLAGVAGRKVILLAGLSQDLVDRGLSAVQWVRSAAKLVDGGGGGRPDMAQAGGTNPKALKDALALAAADIQEQLT